MKIWFYFESFTIKWNYLILNHIESDCVDLFQELVPVSLTAVLILDLLVKSTLILSSTVNCSTASKGICYWLYVVSWVDQTFYLHVHGISEFIIFNHISRLVRQGAQSVYNFASIYPLNIRCYNFFLPYNSQEGRVGLRR